MGHRCLGLFLRYFFFAFNLYSFFSVIQPPVPIGFHFRKQPITRGAFEGIHVIRPFALDCNFVRLASLKKMSESEKLRKIFIGGLNWETEEEGLKDYFSQWGTIVDCVIMKKDGKSRGFGFVTYSSAQSVDDCLKVRGHVLDGRDIEPKRSIPKDEAKNPMALTKTRKIFVGGLASTTTEDDIREYFTEVCKKAGVGQVIDVDLKKDRENSSRIRGFAFVTFDDEEIAEKVCSMKFHEIRMKQCEVKKAEPQSMLRKKHEEEYGSDRDRRDRDRDRDRDSRDRGDRDRGRIRSTSHVSTLNCCNFLAVSVSTCGS